MNGSLTGRTAVITGSGRGIGRAIAVAFAQMGANVVLNSTAASAAAGAVYEELRQMGLAAAVSYGDVRSAEDVKTLCRTAADAFGGIDILVNNAGVTRDKPVAMMSEDDWDDVLDVNLKGAYLCTKAASRYMLKGRWGRIINITSVAGVTGNPGQANYSASKAGLIGLTKATARELAPRGITCNAIAPGFIVSRMTGSLPETVKEKYLDRIPLGRPGTPEDVAGAACFFASELSSYITGQVLIIDGGMVM